MYLSGYQMRPIQFLHEMYFLRYLGFLILCQSRPHLKVTTTYYIGCKVVYTYMFVNIRHIITVAMCEFHLPYIRQLWIVMYFKATAWAEGHYFQINYFLRYKTQHLMRFQRINIHLGQVLRGTLCRYLWS